MWNVWVHVAVAETYRSLIVEASTFKYYGGARRVRPEWVSLQSKNLRVIWRLIVIRMKSFIFAPNRVYEIVAESYCDVIGSIHL